MNYFCTITFVIWVANGLTIELNRILLDKPVTPVQLMISENKSQHQILGSSNDFTIDIDNNSNLAYLGPVYVGTPLQGSALSLFIYDTGSGYLTIPENTCTSCSPYFKYNPNTSSTYSATSSYSTTKLSYGSATLYGSMVTDNVCLANSTESSTCVNQF